MDDADLAQEREQAIITAALSARETSLKSPDGLFLWCRDEPIVANSAFCSADCGEDYSKHKREMKQRIE